MCSLVSVEVECGGGGSDAGVVFADIAGEGGGGGEDNICALIVIFVSIIRGAENCYKRKDVHCTGRR